MSAAKESSIADFYPLQVALSTRQRMAHYATKGWKVTGNFELEVAVQTGTKLQPVLALFNGADRLGFISLWGLNQFAQISTTVVGALSLTVYKLRKAHLSQTFAAVAAATVSTSAAAAAGRDSDPDGDVAMEPAAQSLSPATPPPQNALHGSFDFYESKPVFRDGYSFSLTMMAEAMRLRLRLLLLADTYKDGSFFAQLEKLPTSELGVLYLADGTDVNIDRLTMTLVRHAMHARPQHIIDAWHQAERALLKRRIELAMRGSSAKETLERLASRVIKGARSLSTAEFVHASNNHDAIIAAKGSAWLAAPFESVLPLVRGRDVLMLQGAALFKFDETKLQRLAGDYFNKTVLRQEFPRPPEDARVRSINAEFIQQFQRSFSMDTQSINRLAMAAAWGEPPQLLVQLQYEARFGAPRCIADKIRMMAKRKASPGKVNGEYLKHEARLAFGWYIRARGFSETSRGVVELLRGGMFRDEKEWKGIKADIFPPARLDRNNYNTSCSAFQKGGHCPYMTEGVHGDQARGLCAASVKLTDQVLKRPIDYTNAFYALHPPTAAAASAAVVVASKGV